MNHNEWILVLDDIFAHFKNLNNILVINAGRSRMNFRFGLVLLVLLFPVCNFTFILHSFFFFFFFFFTVYVL